MDKSEFKRLGLSSMIMLGLSLGCTSETFAAKSIDLRHQSASVLKQFNLSPAAAAVKNELGLHETSRSQSLNKTHIRIQQTFAGHPILGADAVVHVSAPLSGRALSSVMQANAKQVSMNGTIYEDIARDLGNISEPTLAAKRDSLMQKAIETYQLKTGGKSAINNQKSELVVYIDNANKAHWAYKISFDTKAKNLLAKPVYVMDALTDQIYEEWNNLQTSEAIGTLGGGFGGNKKMGKLVYDGLTNDLPTLNIQRDAGTGLCTLKNNDVTVQSDKTGGDITFFCSATDTDHNNVYWWGDQDAVNGAYSPSDDALFGGAVIKDMYQKWYGIPVLTDENGKPLMLTMIVHVSMENAYWDPDAKTMSFGDGGTTFYPLTSLGVAAHEISHGFTSQHSNLTYYGQSGGMNEAFSDMAAQAAEFYAYSKNSWQIGPEIFKAENEALRYMDQPSKDCYGSKPGNWCSIDTADQYYNGLDVHFSSGVYNHFFYILGNTEGWDVKKAFDVMVKANMNYWTSGATFKEAACGVIDAARELNYDEKAVRDAFSEVKVATTQCE